MASNNLDQTVSDMKAYIRRNVAAGFSSADEIVNLAVSVFKGDHDESLLRPLAEKLASAAIAAHGKAQLTWPETTDCDLLDRAFGELERAGIVSRQNFTCCGT